VSAANVRSIYLDENRVGELALSEAASSSYIAHMVMLGSLLVYATCFVVPLNKVPQVLDIQFASEDLTLDSHVNSEQRLPERPQPILPLTKPARYEQDFARVFDGREKTAAIKSAQQSAAATSDPKRINSAESTILPLPLPAPSPTPPSLRSFQPPNPQLMVPIASIEQHPPFPGHSAAASPASDESLMPVPSLPEALELPVLPLPSPTTPIECPRPPMPDSLRVDELMLGQSARLLPRLSGNDMNESVPVPVAPLMGFTGSKEAIVGPVPVALSSQPQTGSLFAVKPVVSARDFVSDPVHDDFPSEPAPSVTLRYMQDVERRIKRKWFPPWDQSQCVVVWFKVHRSGEVSDVRVQRGGDESDVKVDRRRAGSDLSLANTSELSLKELAALKAVRDAAPFASLPPEFESSEADIQFTFDWSVFNRDQGLFRRF
jgi:hypothetical protein